MAPSKDNLWIYLHTHPKRCQSMLFKQHPHITKSRSYKKHPEKLFLIWQISLCLNNLTKQFLSKLHLFNDTQSHATFALQLLSSSCLIRWCYWLRKNKDLPVKEKNVLDKNVLHCVLILLATRCLTGFYTIKFLPFVTAVLKIISLLK